MGHYVGIDIGGTGIAGALVSNTGEISSRKELPTPVKEGGPAILQQALQVAHEVISSSTHTVNGIGVGTGGQIDAVNGTVYSATAVLPGYQGLRIAEAFENKFNIATKVDNDVNVLGLGELRFGAARTYSQTGCVVFLALGTGVGGALSINGKLHHGAHWTGGNFGHILLSMPPNTRRLSGGARNSLELEAYCSGPALVETYRELTNASEEMTGEEVVRRAVEKSDSSAKRAIKLTGEYLGYGLVSLANALDPHLIVVGGGLSELGDVLLDPARRILREYAMPGPAKCPVVTASLGQDAAIVGAASLVIPSS